MATPSPFSYALVGAGRVGTAVAALLQRAGHHPVAVASRSAASAQRAAHLLDAEIHPIDALPPADVVLIGAPDGAITEAATQVAPRVTAGSVVVHFAGSLGVAALEPVVAAGAEPAALHPVQACPDIDTAIRRLPGSAWGVTCSATVEEWATGLVTIDLGGRAYRVPEEIRPLWHSAASVTSNGLAALLATGEELLRAAGIDDPDDVLGPLATGTLANALEGGGGGPTLTGPAVRGDSVTVDRHIDAIGRLAPELRESYKLVSLLTVLAALRAGRIDEAVAREMRNLLEARA